VITPYLPYRNVGHAGGKAIYDFIVELKKRTFKVCLASLAWPEESRHFDDLKELCDDTYFLVSVPVFTDTLIHSLQTEPVTFIPRVFKGIAKHLRLRSSLNHGIRQMIRRHQPDLVQVEYTFMALYFKRLKSARFKVLHLHDLMIKPYRRLWIGEPDMVARFFRFLFFAVLKSIELAFCRSFDRVLVKSNYDRNLLLQHGQFDAQVFPLGIQPETEIATCQSREAKSVLFVGAMFREVNEKAAVYFIDHVMPALEKRVGPVKFYVVGCSPSRRLKERATDKIIVTGFVDDLSSFYRRCHVFVAPLFVGGGMIFKILQAMTFGLPVVSSTVGNEGIRAANGSDILIADNPEEFANHLALLITDAALWQRISTGGRTFVNANFAWDVVIERYLDNLSLNA
jgi:glycosyltransferase involved in cell wall biosynthesis